MKNNWGNSWNRRCFLKASGVAIGLPFLTSLQTRAQEREAHRRGGSKKNMVFVATPLGMNPEGFIPQGHGNNFTPGTTTAPLADHRKDVTIFSHIDHPMISNKHSSIRCFLNGSYRSGAIGTYQSVDQAAAEEVGYNTRFPSIHMALGGGLGASWTKSGMVKREVENPHDMFKQLFLPDSEAAKHALQKEIDEQGSILDLVRVEAKRLERSVSQVDRHKLDEYLTAIREAEKTLQGMKMWADREKPKIAESHYDLTEDAKDSLDFDITAPLMFDVVFLALQSGSTRVATAGFGLHNKKIGLEGVGSGYHSLSHHGNRPDTLKQLHIIERFYMEQLARFIAKCKESPTLGGTMLDDTMICFGSGLSDASRHSNRDLPVVFAGGGFKHQGHIDVKQANGSNTRLNNLFVTMLQRFGQERDRFGDSNGNLNHLFV